jgi:hypothetical protein
VTASRTSAGSPTSPSRWSRSRRRSWPTVFTMTVSKNASPRRATRNPEFRLMIAKRPAF